MHIDFSRFDHVHLMGDSAMHPIAVSRIMAPTGQN